eukprot:329768-Rhodomonas_salina.2
MKAPAPAPTAAAGLPPFMAAVLLFMEAVLLFMEAKPLFMETKLLFMEAKLLCMEAVLLCMEAALTRGVVGRSDARQPAAEEVRSPRVPREAPVWYTRGRWEGFEGPRCGMRGG